MAASLHELAAVLLAQGDLAGARESLEHSLSIQARVFGTTEHYSTCQTELNLSVVLAQLGEVSDALELARHALSVFERVLPPGHGLTRSARQQVTMLVSGEAPS